MFAATVVLAMRGVTGSDMYDLFGSLSVFGFLTAYALVAVALPFARSARGQHSHPVAAAQRAHGGGDDPDCRLRSSLQLPTPPTRAFPTSISPTSRLVSRVYLLRRKTTVLTPE